MHKRAALWLIAGFLYMVWPFDIVPDFLVLVGWVDDLLIAGLAVYMALRSLRKKIEPPPKDPPRRGDVIDVEVEKDE